MARRQWRCFHCDAVFRSEHAAGIHFGADQAGTCACVLPHEQHLVEHIRELESQLASYRSDSDRVLLSIMTLESEHRRALQREEEKGYERGMRDAEKTREPIVFLTADYLDGPQLRCTVNGPAHIVVERA